MRNVLILILLATLTFGVPGCKSLFVNKGPKEVTEETGKTRKKAFFIGDTAVPDGMDWMEITSVSLAVNLADTGSDPPESRYRTMLLREMASQNVPRPSKVLQNPTNSLVVVTGYLPPGTQKGDTFDIDVTIPEDSETTSLRGGYLLPSRMREIMATDDVHEGSTRAKCSGPIIVEPLTGTERDKVTQCRGQVLGGGVSTYDRRIGLRVKQDTNKPDVYRTMKIEKAINRRFQIQLPSGEKVNVAKTSDDKYVNLTIPPKYKENKSRFFEVVRCIPILETEAKRLERLQSLEKRLLDSTTARRAALELEAIGRPGIDTLKLGLNSSDAMVQFYSAEALAYLDESESAEVLGRVALNDHTNRAFALRALGALDDLYAYEELRKLMNAPTAETRYGAFRALSLMRPEDPLVLGESLGNNTFRLCVVPGEGKPMLHITKASRAEIVLFGENQNFKYPLVVEGTNNIVIRATTPTEIVVSRFAPNRPDEKRTISTNVADVIRALSEVGAQYPDVIEILQSAIAQNALDSSFRIDAIPSVTRGWEANRPDQRGKKKKQKQEITAEADEIPEYEEISENESPEPNV